MTQPRTKSLFLTRWGQDAVDVGFTMVPNAFIDKIHALGTSPSQALALLVLIRHWYRGGNPKVFKKKIADTLGISVKQVGKILLALETDRLLVRKHRRKAHNEYENDSTEFDLTPLVSKVAGHARVLNDAKKKSKAIREGANAKKRGAEDV